jgi:hypothetical protein
MIECPKCGAKYQEQRVFCGKCRFRMGNPCRLCGFDNLMDDHFCGRCGRSLSVSEPDLVQAVGPTGEQGNKALFYDQLLFDAGKDKKSFADASTTLDSAAITQLFHENED